MGKLLDRLLEGSHAYRVIREADGYTLVSQQDCLDEFSELVREAVDHAGEDFVVFPVCDGSHRYSEMFVMPLDDAPPSD